MNKLLSLLAAAVFAVTTLDVEAATPKAAESESASVGVAADVPKPRKTKVTPSQTKATKHVKSAKASKHSTKTKKVKKTKRSKKPARSSGSVLK